VPAVLVAMCPLVTSLVVRRVRVSVVVIGGTGWLTAGNICIPTEYGQRAVRGVGQGSGVLSGLLLWGDRTVGGWRSPGIGRRGRRGPPSVIRVGGRGSRALRGW